MIVYDLQAVQSAVHGERGIARFVGDLAQALERRHPGLVDAYLWNDAMPEVDRLGSLALGGRLRPFSSITGRRVDLVHINSPFELNEVGEFIAPVTARRTVVTCYDLIPRRFPDRYLASRSMEIRYISRLPLLVSADAVVTDSASAADDVHHLLGVPEERLTVIGAGVADVFVPPTDSPDARLREMRRELPALEAGYVLVPSGMDWRKNPEGAIAAYAALPRDVIDRHQLVLACRVDDHQRAHLGRLAERLGVADRLVFTGYVSDPTLVRLYQTAEVVLFPSKYEGFGLPVLEARRCGARVICSDASSLPEVLPEPAARFNPWVPDEITATLYRALTDDRFRALLDATPDPGFGWNEAADRVARVYRRLTGRGAPATPDRRAPARSSAPDRPPTIPTPGSAPTPRRRDGAPLRLAVASPLPPTPSGIAHHSERLVRAFAEIDGVDPVAFVSGRASGRDGVVPFPVAELATLPTRWALGEFDAVLYCFGNHEFHRPLVPVLQAVPGAVLLHDVKLTGLYSAHHRVFAMTELGAGPIVRRATSVLVQSRHAAELVATDTGSTAIDVGPLHCVQLGEVPAPIDPDPLWVVSAGIADASKRTDLFAAAAARLAERPGVRGAIVGLGGESFASAVSGVDATGQVTDAEFDAWLRRSTVLVQLRGSSNGESSGVVCDALARGCVVVVSDLGAMSELPDDVVVKVPADISAERLADVVGALLDDPATRARLRANALAYAARETPAAQARRILDTLA